MTASPLSYPYSLYLPLVVAVGARRGWSHVHWLCPEEWLNTDEKQQYIIHMYTPVFSPEGEGIRARYALHTYYLSCAFYVFAIMCAIVF